MTGTQYMKQQYGGLVDDNLCSANCPCDNAVADVTFMDSIGNLADYGATGRQASTGTDANLIALSFAPAGDGVVSTYQ